MATEPTFSGAETDKVSSPVRALAMKPPFTSPTASQTSRLKEALARHYAAATTMAAPTEGAALAVSEKLPPEPAGAAVARLSHGSAPTARGRRQPT